MDDDNTFTITSPANDYDCTVDVTSDLDWGISSISTPSYAGSTTAISLDDLIITDEKRTSVRDSGELPIDIWAKMYNNGVIDDD